MLQSIEIPSCVDLIITDKPGSFGHANVFETGISDHDKLVTTVIKQNLQRLRSSMFITTVTKILARF